MPVSAVLVGHRTWFFSLKIKAIFKSFFTFFFYSQFYCPNLDAPLQNLLFNLLGLAFFIHNTITIACIHFFFDRHMYWIYSFRKIAWKSFICNFSTFQKKKFLIKKKNNWKKSSYLNFWNVLQLIYKWNEVSQKIVHREIEISSQSKCVY